MKQLLLFISIVSSSTCFSQDTIEVEPSIHYSSKKYPTRSKDFAHLVRYAQEDIVYNERKKRVEFCYYYDSERNCFGNSYEILNDSIIEIKRQFSDTVSDLWKYKLQANGLFLVENKKGKFTETGRVTSLVPYSKTGRFTTQIEGSDDSLWVTQYTPKSQYKSVSRTYYPKEIITGKIFLESNVDSVPTLENGQQYSRISLARNSYCLSEPTRAIRTISFVITSTGEIKNVIQFEGNIDIEYCPGYMQDLIKEIRSLGRWNPGVVNAEKVNVRCFLTVDMMDEHLNEFAKHPVFDRKHKAILR